MSSRDGQGNVPHLLVVDNEIDICNFVRSFFELRGFYVSTALNGDEALVKISNEKPQLVILDVMMRTENEGLRYLPKIKKAAPLTKVIMVTGVDDADAIEEAKGLGADDYITKPLVLEYLETTVLQKVRHLSQVSG
jgi:DNA-binding response OmpR family regulator